MRWILWLPYPFRRSDSANEIVHDKVGILEGDVCGDEGKE